MKALAAPAHARRRRAAPKQRQQCATRDGGAGVAREREEREKCRCAARRTGRGRRLALPCAALRARGGAAEHRCARVGAAMAPAAVQARVALRTDPARSAGTVFTSHWRARPAIAARSSGPRSAIEQTAATGCESDRNGCRRRWMMMVGKDRARPRPGDRAGDRQLGGPSKARVAATVALCGERGRRPGFGKGC